MSSRRCGSPGSGATRALPHGGPPDCDPGTVERRFGILGCRAEGHLLRSVMRTGRWMDRSPGRQQAGALAVFADHVLGEFFYVSGPPGRRTLTTELALDVLVPPPWRTAALHATAWIPRREATGGFAQAEVVDDAGDLVAVAAAWLQYMPAAPEPVAAPAAAEAGTAAGTAGAATSLAAHLGTRSEADGECVRVELPEARRWHNVYGVLHGGIWACLAELAAAELLTGRGGLRTANVRVSYLRGAAGPVTAVARPVRLGRSFGVVEVRGLDGAGRTCVTATVTGRGSPA